MVYGGRTVLDIPYLRKSVKYGYIGRTVRKTLFFNLALPSRPPPGQSPIRMCRSKTGYQMLQVRRRIATCFKTLAGASVYECNQGLKLRHVAENEAKQRTLNG